MRPVIFFAYGIGQKGSFPKASGIFSALNYLYRIYCKKNSREGWKLKRRERKRDRGGGGGGCQVNIILGTVSRLLRMLVLVVVVGFCRMPC